MLVLGRKAEQSFTIGDKIKVTILEARSGGYVRIGIEAPPGVKVLRSELVDVCQVCFESPCKCEP
jgi:carbon storage regulator CsrA